MDEPILKMHWERFQAHVDLDVDTAAMLLTPYTKDAINKLILLSEGCANTNYKVTFHNSRPPVVIRIYIREQSSLQREVAIHKLIAGNIPVPTHLYFDDNCTNYPYAYSIMEWIDGTLMRGVILTNNERAISDCLFEAGQYLNILRQMKFSHGGFFQTKLDIRPFEKEERYLPYVLNMLQDGIVKESLGTSLMQAVLDLVNNYSCLLPNEDDANLTHADYDPANIMVKFCDGQWKITGILDWEFSYAGTYLLDIGMMLRYSHKLPPCYEKQFIAGIEESGFTLPATWRKQAKLMDLLCLLQLAHYNPLSDRPKLNKDVVSLITHTVKKWETFKQS